MSRGKRGIFSRVYFNFSQAEMYNGLKSVGTIRYRAYGSCGSGFRSIGSITYSRVGFQSHAKI